MLVVGHSDEVNRHKTHKMTHILVLNPNISYTYPILKRYSIRVPCYSGSPPPILPLT